MFDTTTFATVTFEHDFYTGDYFNTRQKSREIFEKRGYILVFSDVCNETCPFEDWYVHPSLVDMTIVNSILRPSNSSRFRIFDILEEFNELTGHPEHIQE